MPEKRLIFYSAPSLSSFVKKDIEILQSEFQVKVFLFNPSRKFLTPFFFLKQFVFILLHIRATIYISQFGGYHSLLPGIVARMLRKKSFIVTGGTDCVSFPALGYGNFSKPLLGKITCLSYHLADRILPVHASLVQSENNYDSNHIGPQGMLAHCKGLGTPYTVIFNGYAADQWPYQPNKKPKSFISVAAGASDLKRFRLKGLDMICELAGSFPECSFTLVGGTQFQFEINLPENVKLVGFADHNSLVRLFGEHEYYLQLSLSEGFPNALCEAMLCGCVPIGSNVAAIPDIVAETGYILPRRDVKMLSSLIMEALKKPSDLGRAARNRIESLYSLQQRKDLLLKTIKQTS